MNQYRFAEENIKNDLNNFRVVQILGSRQIGKTTTAKKIAEEKNALYFTLDDQKTREEAGENLNQFLTQSKGRLMVLDEVQLMPDVIPQIKKIVDEDNARGQFLLTGSANLLNLSSISESLAGRTSIVEMFGFSQDEIIGKKSNFITHVFENQINTKYTTTLNIDSYKNIMMKGSYPEVIFNLTDNPSKWFETYLKTIVNRDAKDISELRRLVDLPKLLKYIASIQGGELVLSNVSKALNIPRSTLDPYFELLETLFLIISLKPWSKNLAKRVVKNKKNYILDSGLATHLLKNSQDYSGRFESFLVSELIKQLSFTDTGVELFHFRDYDKKEIDVILEDESENIVAIEVKLSESYKNSYINNIKEIRKKYKDKFKAGVVLYAGKVVEQIGVNLWAIPADYIWKDYSTISSL